MSDWFERLAGLLAETWRTLEEGSESAGAPARLVSLATISPGGWPETRTVVLRRVDRDAASVEVHTDRGSDKMRSLAAVPRAELLAWDPGRDLQVRLRTTVTILTGDAVAERWEQVPDTSQTAYGKAPPPGTEIAEALGYRLTPAQENFAALVCRVDAMDVVHLGTDHRRAMFRRDEDWQGRWLSP